MQQVTFELWFHLPIPRKGTETALETFQTRIAVKVSLTYSPQGDGNILFPESPYNTGVVSLTYSPQGDGNKITNPTSTRLTNLCFTYLFPARGRKLRKYLKQTKTVINVSLTYSPQGDGNS